MAFLFVQYILKSYGNQVFGRTVFMLKRGPGTHWIFRLSYISLLIYITLLGPVFLDIILMYDY